MKKKVSLVFIFLTIAIASFSQTTGAVKIKNLLQGAWQWSGSIKCKMHIENDSINTDACWDGTGVSKHFKYYLSDQPIDQFRISDGTGYYLIENRSDGKICYAIRSIDSDTLVLVYQEDMVQELEKVH